MRKLTKLGSALAVVVTMGSLISAVQASPAPPSIVPTAVVQAGYRTHAAGSPHWGPDEWGFDMYTSMKVIDNQNPPRNYALGKVHESFYNLEPKLACPADLAKQLAKGAGILNHNGAYSIWDPTVGYISNGVFTDHNFTPSAGPLTSPTANTGNDQWFTVIQHWHIQDCPGTSYALPAGVIPPGQPQLDLNTNLLDYRQTYYLRSPGF